MISSSTADILHLSSFYPSDTKLVKIVEDNNQVSIYLKSQIHVQICSKCGHDSNKYPQYVSQKITRFTNPWKICLYLFNWISISM